jgi:hypothetical protein
MSKMIVKGYKGVMELDLSLLPAIYRDSAVTQHYQDIIEYKKYQKSLKPEHRYENTIERIKKQHKNENYLRNLKLEEEENKRYELVNKLYNLNK